MHRSGTSAIAGFLNKMGIALGSKLMLPNEYNAKGYFENADIVRTNDHILQTLDSAWDDLFLLEEGWWQRPQMLSHRVAVKEIINKEFSENELFCIKDPRISILLPFWISILQELDIKIYFLIPMRQPIEVAESLKERNGFSIQKGLLLWMNNMLSIEYYSRPFKRSFFIFDDFLKNPIDIMRRISNTFSIVFPNPKSQIDIMAKELLDPKLKHHNVRDLELNSDRLSLIDRFNAILFNLNDNEELDENDLIAIDEIRSEYKRLNFMFYNPDFRHASLLPALWKRDAMINDLNEELVRRGEWALKLDAALKEENAKLATITHSYSWRLTSPLREMWHWASAPKAQGKRYKKSVLHLAKRFYQSLSLSYQTKAAHRKMISKYFPKLLSARDNPSATIPILTLPAIRQTTLKQFANRADFAKTIKIPISQSPIVSVIIPIYGKIDYTLRCLASIMLNLPQASFEIIVVDDCSPDDSAEKLAYINHIRLIRNKQNQGFIRSCNAGAHAAYGKYLYFLNNDTEVTPGWMDELLRTFQEFPGTGLAGSKLIYPDGKLQEAGGIIWQNGSAWNFGRFQDPLLPVYNYAREVDYCSGASIMVPKALFDESEGFDEHYLPAYCEDADLAVKIRAKGYRVIYQPMSTVIHYEGVTSGTDPSQGIKAYQIKNLKKFYERWKDHLQSHPPLGMDADNVKDHYAMRRVLVMDHCTPTPNQDSGSIDVLNIMLLLREMGFQVTFIPEDNFCYMPEYTAMLQRNGIEVLYAPYCTSVKQHLKKFGARYDLVFLFRIGVVQRNIKTIRKYCQKAKVIFDTVDLHFLRMKREAELFHNAKMIKAAEKMKTAEYAALCAVDAATVVSTEEYNLLKMEFSENRIYLLPFSRNIRGTDKTFAERHDIVFVGGYQHSPNVDAVSYFVSEVMPLLRHDLPGIRFYVVGSKPPAKIQALAREDVIIMGFVDDLEPLLDRMRVSVAPLRYGAGIKGKIATTMAVGLPTVASSLAVEGMSLTHGENILVADGAKAFAEAVAHLYRNETLWKKLSHNGLEFAEKAWGSETAWVILESILRDIGILSVKKHYPLRLWTNSTDFERSHIGYVKKEV
jgi:GT2 family glycosyltransferase/glycosyltransferase involved in cell wall biosynthesis